MNKAIFGDNLEWKMPLAVKSSFEPFGKGGGKDGIHHLRFRDSLEGDIAFISAAAINIIGSRREIN